jgi:hypothetical protein
MIDTLLNTLKVGLVTTSVFVASIFGLGVTQEANLGATYQTPEVRALFTTTLASKITSTDTSMTLVSATDKDGNTLASSTYGFIIDEGTASEEFVLADCSGTNCTNMTRGLSVLTGTSTVASLRFEHRRGASVKMTDAPILLFLGNVVKGRQHLENTLKYSSNISTSTVGSSGQNLANVEFVNSVAFDAAGVVGASESVAGYVELATGAEAASSTSEGGTANRLALPASIASGSYNSGQSNRVVVTGDDNKIDNGFISTTTLTASSTIIGSTLAFNIGKTIYVSTSTATTSWSVPNGVQKIQVEMVGGGSSGNGVSSNDAGAGGHAGAYFRKIIDVTSTTTLQLKVGKGGVGVAGASSMVGSSTILAVGSTIYTTGSGPTPGTQGDVNIYGGYGENGIQDSYTTTKAYGGNGGGSYFGSGGRGCSAGTGQCGGEGAVVVGAGGGGAARGSSGSGNQSGGNGADGIIIITY